jgi:oxygen-dependent protoporphyrinogen oxidase
VSAASLSKPSVVIVGGGVSGLATAYYLAQSGLHSTIVEKSSRLGGLIKTDVIEGCQLEAGPDSYIATKPAVSELSKLLNNERGEPLTDDIIGSNDARRRVLVVRRGRLVPLPKGMVMMAPAEWRPMLASPLFSARTKLRFLRETLATPHERSGDISIQELVVDHFGDEVLEYLAEPLLSGVYGGLAGQLSAQSVLPRFVDYERQYGSIVRGVRHERRDGPKSPSLFLSFRNGMQTLTDALASAIQPFCQVMHSEATLIERTGEQRTGKQWRVLTDGQCLDADELILACPAHAAALLLRHVLPDLAVELSAIPFSSAVLVTLVYETAQLNHPLDAFGFLVPRAERKTIAAATWIGTKFPARLPHGLSALRAFIVEPEASALLHAPERELVELVTSDFKRLMGIRAEPRFATVYRWPRSMPQYVVGHEARRQKIEGYLSDAAGLHLVGNSYSGVGIPDCVRLAEKTAKLIYLRTQLTSSIINREENFTS